MQTHLTKKARKRAGEIIRELCRLSRDGWRHARLEDYQPLERELRALLGALNQSIPT